jgi:hypothetical protein
MQKTACSGRVKVIWEYANDAEANAQDNADMLNASSLVKVSVNAIGLASDTTYDIGDVDTAF